MWQTTMQCHHLFTIMKEIMVEWEMLKIPRKELNEIMNSQFTISHTNRYDILLLNTYYYWSYLKEKSIAKKLFSNILNC